MSFSPFSLAEINPKRILNLPTTLDEALQFLSDV